jgi:hypothetical protein
LGPTGFKNNDFRRLSEASGGRQGIAQQKRDARRNGRPAERRGSTRKTKARIFARVHRHRVGALLGVVFGAVSSLDSPARADIENPESRLETGYIQYGAALAAELLASAGAICPQGAAVPCVIGSGGGLGVRVGYRFHSPFYLGAAYEFSKQDAHKSIYLAILQQLRAEARYFIPVRGSYVPFVSLAAGGVGYGSQWSLQTLGGMASLGVGLELELSRTSAMTFIASYRPMLLTNWRGSTLLDRPTGVLSMIGLEIGLEQRVPVYQPANP